MISDDVKGRLRRLLELREKSEQAKVAADAAKADYKAMERDVWEDIENSDLKGAIKIDLGEPYGTVTFQKRETFFARIIDAEAAEDYYRAQDSLETVSEIKFSKARLNEVVREAIDTGTPLPPGLDWTPTRYVSVTIPK
jgi:hypothetical protein